MWNTKNTVQQANRARHCKKKRNFEKTELFLRNLIWNVESKLSEVNEAAIIVLMESTK